MNVNVRISQDILNRIRKLVRESKPRITIIGYVDAALDSQLKKDEAKAAKKK